jgi:hypothetical protein
MALAGKVANMLRTKVAKPAAAPKNKIAARLTRRAAEVLDNLPGSLKARPMCIRDVGSDALSATVGERTAPASRHGWSSTARRLIGPATHAAIVR